jgi:hypothetical protein
MCYLVAQSSCSDPGLSTFRSEECLRKRGPLSGIERRQGSTRRMNKTPAPAKGFSTNKTELQLQR